MKGFYVKYLYTKVSELYYNPKTQFQSYFLSFESGSLLEIMTNKHLIGRTVVNDGFAHLAMSVGTKIDVDNFVEKFLSEQYPLLSGPRITGDGYYEAIFQDPEGNLIELTTDLEN